MTRTKPAKRQYKIDYSNYSKYQMEMELNEKEKAFCCEYVRMGWNKTKAYSKAYNNKNLESCSATSSALLRKPKIKRYIELIKNDLEELCQISKASQIKEYMKIGYSSISALHNDWMDLKDFQKLSDDDKAAIESTEFREYEKVDKDGGVSKSIQIKIKLHSKIGALNSIDKVMGYNSTDRLDITTKDKPINQPVNLSNLSDDEIEQYAQLNLKIKGV